MGKSSKKTNVEVVPAVPEVIAKPVKKGKRDAEVVLEKEVSAKRQKKNIEKVVPKDIKNLKKALKDVPAITKPKTNSSEDDSSSDSEEEVKVPQTKRSKLAKAPKKESSSSEESSSDDEPAKTVPTSDKKVSVAAKNGSAAAVTKKEKESSSSESDSDEDEEDAPKAAKVVPAAKKQATIVTDPKKKDESSDSSESDSDTDDDDKVAPKAAPAAKKQATTVANLKKSNDSSETDSDETDDDSDESDDEPQPKKSNVTDSLPSKMSNANSNAKNVKESDSSDEDDDDSEEDSEDEPSNTQNLKKDSVPSSKTKPVAKAVKKESSSSVEDSDESSDDEPSKQQQAKKSTQALKKSSSSDSSEESSDEESEDEKPLKTPKKDLDVKMKDADVASAEKPTATKSENKTNQTPGSRTLFVGNLSFDVGQDDVAEFFKEAGEVVEVRLSAAEDGSFKGFGHVEFSTVEAAKKALELNGQELFGRAVRLDLARERGSYNPQSRKDSYQKGSKGQSQTIFVKGFDRSLVEDQIRSSLEEHFGSCGEITRVSIPKDYDTGASKGIAYIDFTNQDAFNKAFELNGSDLGGYSLTVDEARPKADNYNSGSSGGGDRGRSGGRFAGRGGGGRGGRGDRGRGRDFGGRGRGGRGGAPYKQSAGTASTGKKITFSDD